MAYIEIKIWCEKHNYKELEAKATGKHIHVETCEICLAESKIDEIKERLDELMKS
jgi:hypothetical protein